MIKAYKKNGKTAPSREGFDHVSWILTHNVSSNITNIYIFMLTHYVSYKKVLRTAHKLSEAPSHKTNICSILTRAQISTISMQEWFLTLSYTAAKLQEH